MYKFKEGDKVRVVKKCVSYSNCHYGKEWNAGWNEDMTKYILSKEVGEVAETNLRTGIRVIFKDNSWYFPSDALELVEDSTLVDEKDLLESLITECSLYFDEVSIYIDKPEEKIEYTLQIDGYKFVGTKEYVVSKMKGAIEWTKP